MLLLSVLVLCSAADVIAAPPQAVVDYAKTQLTALGTDPVIVNAVKAENAKAKTLDQIKAADTAWSSTAGIAPNMKAIMDSECGKQLIAWRDKNTFVSEVFVMDNQGANVAMTDKTSDYWQGDEDKFIKCFNGGDGVVFVGDESFDESAQVYQVQVSVPVMDGGATIGAICIGINLDEFK